MYRPSAVLAHEWIGREKKGKGREEGGRREGGEGWKEGGRGRGGGKGGIHSFQAHPTV
jgi:hypothetical protein